MENFREIKNSLAWHNEGKFEVELVNGIITKLNFCEPGKGPQDTGKCLTSTNFKYLQSVYSCLGDLFTFIEEENKRLGYSYSRIAEDQKPYKAEFLEGDYPLTSETKLRPLINYEHTSETDNLTESINHLLDARDNQQDIELSA
jgi:hypothetical protein